MPSSRQRKEIGAEQYASGSRIKVRNDALALAKELSPLRFDQEQAVRFIATGRAVRLLDYCTNGSESGAHACAGLEPFFLVEDGLDAGQYRAVAIYDTRVGAVEDGSQLCWVIIGSGEALLSPDTLVLWE